MATPNPIQPIQPLNIPSAAGINYGEGDVRHFAQGDAMSVPGISNPTRQLAERDNLLAEKLNEVIQNVNNQEQFVPLPIVRTVVPPNDQTVVMNYRIPEGFESRILNATIGSNPSSPDVELDIYYNTTFGGATGTAVVTTTTEFTGGVNFYQAGEFIVTLKNKSGITLEMVASILLTLRPLGSEGTLLVGSVIQGKKGDPGQGGPPGPRGIPGSGGVGSPGMNWTGTWVNNHVYSQRDVARYDLGFQSVGVGSIVSSFFCLQGHTSSDAIIPQYTVTTYWEPVALGGSTGGTGPIGPAGPAGGIVFSGAETTVDGTIVAGTPYTGGDVFIPLDSGYAYDSRPVAAPGDTVLFPMRETYFTANVVSPKGIAFLNASVRTIFTGWGTLILPKQIYGAQVDYSTASIDVVACTNGTVVGVLLSQDVISYVDPNFSDRFVFAVLNSTKTPVDIQISGMQIL